MKVRLSENARIYLRQEAAYLRKRNPAAAVKYVTRLREARTNLARFPELGSFSDELPLPGIRRIVVGDYLVDYEVKQGEVWIVAVRHGQQLLPGTPVDDDFDYEAHG
jgi:plasmid stabilization system protein ParE